MSYVIDAAHGVIDTGAASAPTGRPSTEDPPATTVVAFDPAVGVTPTRRQSRRGTGQ